MESDRGESSLQTAIDACNRMNNRERVKLLKHLAEKTGLTISYGGSYVMANLVCQIYISEKSQVAEIVSAVAETIRNT